MRVLGLTYFYVSGIQLVRSGLEPLQPHTIVEPWGSYLCTTLPTRSLSTVGTWILLADLSLNHLGTDIRVWHSNVEQHASEGVDKILIGNKSDWTDKRVVTEQQGRQLANELGVKFMETSAKVNEGVEEAFFELARYASVSSFFTWTLKFSAYRAIKSRLLDSQAHTVAQEDASKSVAVNQQAVQSNQCCS